MKLWTDLDDMIASEEIRGNAEPIEVNDLAEIFK
jgi:hypothetical protein